MLRCSTHHKLLDRIVSGARLNGVVIECDIAHCRSVAVLCILHNIMCNPIHALYDALPVPRVPARVVRNPLAAHRYTYVHASSLQNLSAPPDIYNDNADPVFDGVGLASIKSRTNVFLCA